MLRDYRIIVTGASGWLGRYILDYLYKNYIHNSCSIVCFGSKKSVIKLSDGFTVSQIPINQMASLDKQPTILFHFAFLTKDKTRIISEAEYLVENQKIDNYVSSCIEKIGVETVVLSSSGAVYSYLHSNEKPKFIINDPYAYLKMKQEELYTGWSNETSKKLIVPRIFNLSGAYINKVNHYAISSMIIDALNGSEINIRSDKLVFRSYSAVENLIELVFCQIFDRDLTGVTCYDVCGTEIVELDDLAKRVFEVLGIVGGTIKRGRIALGARDYYVGNEKKYSNYLKHYEIEQSSLSQQIQNTAVYLKMLQKN